MGDEVTLVSSAEETAKDVYRTLVAHNLLRTSTAAPTLRFQATGDAKPFGKLARRFLGPEVTNVEHLPNDMTASHAVIYEVADTTAIPITPEHS
jgi:glutamate racemase